MSRRFGGLLIVTIGLAACGLGVVGQSTLGDGAGEGGVQAAGDAMVVTPPVDGAQPGPDARVDAGADGPVIVAACQVGEVRCNGGCVASTDCATCVGGAKYLCGPTRTCVTGCQSCTDLVGVAMPIECIACNTSQSNPIGSCGYASNLGFCLNGNYSMAYKGGPGEHCDCSNTDVANCPGANQICNPAGGTDWCVTCGEAGQVTNGKPCKGGGTCNATASPPRCM